MKAPKTISWFVAVLLGLLAVLIHMGVVAIVGLPIKFSPFWMAITALGFLALANVIPKL